MDPNLSLPQRKQGMDSEWGKASKEEGPLTVLTSKQTVLQTLQDQLGGSQVPHSPWHRT